VVAQTDMFESVKRLTNAIDAELTVTCESIKKRYKYGLTQASCAIWLLLARCYPQRRNLPDDPNDISPKTQHELLGLPDDGLVWMGATEAGIDLVKVL
jgi:hypothetical protein